MASICIEFEKNQKRTLFIFQSARTLISNKQTRRKTVFGKRGISTGFFLTDQLKLFCHLSLFSCPMEQIIHVLLRSCHSNIAVS